MDDKKEIRCSFCGKTKAEVKNLIVGPSNNYICNECIEQCLDVLEQQDPYQDRPNKHIFGPAH